MMISLDGYVHHIQPGEFKMDDESCDEPSGFRVISSSKPFLIARTSLWISTIPSWFVVAEGFIPPMLTHIEDCEIKKGQI